MADSRCTKLILSDTPATVVLEMRSLDGTLLRLVNQRAALALLIGRIKTRRKWPVFDAQREAFVLRRVMRANRGPLSDRAVARIFHAILGECRRRERSVTEQ